MKKILFVLIAFVMIVSCGGRHARVDYISSTDLYVGWLDLKAWDFKRFGYEKQADWQKDIEAANAALKESVAQKLKMYTVTGAGKQWEAQPAKGYIVQFANAKLDPEAGLSVDVAIKDGAYGRTISRFTSTVEKSTSKNPFAERLNRACQAVANDIYMQMTE